MAANNATIVQIRRGTTAQTAAYTGSLGELIYVTDSQTISIQDGVTQGGNFLATYNFANSAFNQANTANILLSYYVANTGAQNISGTLNVANATVSSSYTTGAVVVQGGIGTSGNVYAGAIYTNSLYYAANGLPFLTGGGSGSVSAVYDLDDISNYLDGVKNTFKLSYNANTAYQTFTNPWQLTVTINGLIQPAFNYKYDQVWMANILTASKGYTIDNDYNLKFADSPPPGSQVLIRTVVGATQVQNKIYPFKPLDIVMGF